MVPLKVNDLDHSHYVRLHYTASVPAGTSLEDVLNPAFWCNHAFKLKRGTLIEILSEDSALDCELRVLEVGQTFAKVRLLRNYTEASAQGAKASATPEDIAVDYGGKNDRWRIIHRGEVVQAGMETKAEAEKAAEDFRSKLTA